jgi:hypothetical protein
MSDAVMTKSAIGWTAQAWLILLGFHAAIRILGRLLPVRNWRHGCNRMFLVAVMVLLVVLRCRPQENATGAVIDADQHPVRR